MEEFDPTETALLSWVKQAKEQEGALAPRGRTYQEDHRDVAPRSSPRWGMALLPNAMPRQVRFHDLRHTTATLLLKAGVSLATVQRLLRHSAPTITSESYGQLDVEEMRSAVNRLAFEDMPLPRAEPVVVEPPIAVTADGLGAARGARVVRSVSERKVEGPESVGFLQGTQGLHLVGETGFEPATPWSRTPADPVGAGGSDRTQSQVVEIPDSRVHPRSHSVAQITSDGTPRGAPVVRTSATPLALVQALLTVKEVAARLGVCRATAYRLIEQGGIPHIRVSNAIRVRPADLDAYIAQGGAQ